MEDINAMFQQINSGQTIKLPLKTHSYQEWTMMLETYVEKEIEKEQSYWEQVLIKDFTFPMDNEVGEDTVNSSETLTVQLDEDFTERLLKKATVSYNIEPKDLLITSLVRTLKELTGNEEIVIELEAMAGMRCLKT